MVAFDWARIGEVQSQWVEELCAGKRMSRGQKSIMRNRIRSLLKDTEAMIPEGADEGEKMACEVLLGGLMGNITSNFLRDVNEEALVDLSECIAYCCDFRELLKDIPGERDPELKRRIKELRSEAEIRVLFAWPVIDCVTKLLGSCPPDMWEAPLFPEDASSTWYIRREDCEELLTALETFVGSNVKKPQDLESDGEISERPRRKRARIRTRARESTYIDDDDERKSEGARLVSLYRETLRWLDESKGETVNSKLGPLIRVDGESVSFRPVGLRAELLAIFRWSYQVIGTRRRLEEIRLQEEYCKLVEELRFSYAKYKLHKEYEGWRIIEKDGEALARKTLYSRETKDGWRTLKLGPSATRKEPEERDATRSACLVDPVELKQEIEIAKQRTTPIVQAGFLRLYGDANTRLLSENLPFCKGVIQLYLHGVLASKAIKKGLTDIASEERDATRSACLVDPVELKQEIEIAKQRTTPIVQAGFLRLYGDANTRLLSENLPFCKGVIQLYLHGVLASKAIKKGLTDIAFLMGDELGESQLTSRGGAPTIHDVMGKDGGLIVAAVSAGEERWVTVFGFESKGKPSLLVFDSCQEGRELVTFAVSLFGEDIDIALCPNDRCCNGQHAHDCTSTGGKWKNAKSYFVRNWPTQKNVRDSGPFAAKAAALSLELTYKSIVDGGSKLKDKNISALLEIQEEERSMVVRSEIRTELLKWRSRKFT